MNNHWNSLFCSFGLVCLAVAGVAWGFSQAVAGAQNPRPNPNPPADAAAPAEPGSNPAPEAEGAERPAGPPAEQGLAPEPAGSEPASQDAADSASSEPAAEPAAEAAGPAVRRLKFSFRQQRWVDVLEWLAAQADLSLVLDAPPPGSFNYTDNREYTPTEAIDLVNGVLATKGYTLVRRERMLVLVNLTVGLPRTLIPRISLDELDGRGRFEMVSIAFPIGGRDMEAVTSEIKVLLGPHGEIAPMLASKQILVTDRAGVMRTIAAVIESIPEPKPPRKKPEPPKPKEPEKPELRVYKLDGADPAATIETLEALIGQAKFIYDPEADHMNAYATPSQHTAIESLVKQMRGDVPEGRRPRLEVYPIPPLEGMTGESILESLTVIAPAAVARVDETADQLFVWAKPRDHENIQSAIVKLIQVDQLDGRRSIRLFTLQRTEPTALGELLQKAFPKAGITVDGPGRRMVVQAPEQDLEIIAQVVEQFDTEPPTERLPELRIYPIDRRMADRVAPLVTGLAPEAEVTVDAPLGRVTIVATAQAHQRIQPLLNTLQKAAESLPAEMVQVYPIPATLRDRFESIRTFLTGQVPNAKLFWEPGTLELTVWANAEDQDRIRTALDRLQANDLPEVAKQTIEIYKVSKSLQTRFNTIRPLLTERVPHAKLMWDEKALELTVWAYPADHATIQELLRQLDRQDPADPLEESVEVHQIPRELADRFESFQSLMTTKIPDAKLFWDKKSAELTVWGLERDHAIVRALLKQLGAQAPREGTEETIEVHKIPRALRDRFESTQTLLTEQVPDAKLLWDAERFELTVWAMPIDHATVQQFLDQLGKEPATKELRRMVAYPVAMSDLTAVVGVLQKIAPDAQIISDIRNRRVMVWASDEEQEAVAEAVRGMNQDADAGAERSYMSHPVQGMELSLAVKLLTESFPGISFEQDTNRERLIVLATDAEHEQIAKTLQEIRSPPREDAERRVVVYAIDRPSSDAVAQVLTELLPNAHVVTKLYSPNISIRGTDEEHALAKEVIDQWVKNAEEPTQPVATVYTLEHVRAIDLIPQLKQLMPSVGLVEGAEPNTILARAIADDHLLLKQFIEAADQPATDPGDVMAIYPLPSDRFESFRALLDERQANKLYVVPVGRNRVIVRAPAAIQKQIQQMVDQLGPVVAEKPTIKVYRLRNIDPANLVASASILRAVAPDAQVVPNIAQRRVLIWATAEEHQEIAKAIEGIEGNQEEHGERTYMSHPIKGMDPAMAARLLAESFPNVTFEQDPTRERLIAFATAAEHEAIQQTLVEIEAPAAEDANRHVVVYATDRRSSDAIANVLTDLLPAAHVVARPYAPNVSVRGTDEEQALAKAVVDQWVQHEKEPTQPIAKNYTLDHIRAADVITQLKQLIPSAGLVEGTEPNTILASATAEEHALVQEFLDAADQPVTHPGDVMTVYKLPSDQIESLRELLDERLANQMQIVAAGRDRVIVRAPHSVQDRIRELIDQLGSVVAGIPSVQVYTLKHANPNWASAMIRRMMPDVLVVPDPTTRTLAVTAPDIDHERIAAALDALDQPGKATEPVVSVVPVDTADPTNLLKVLQNAYANDVGMNFSYDTSTRSILVVGPADRHAEVKSIIAAADQGGEVGRTQHVEVYPLGQTSGYAARQMLTQLLAREREPVTLTLESSGNQLVAVANDRQHALIREALEQLQPLETEFEVFALEIIDPLTAETAIRELFGREMDGATGPMVDADSANYRLYVRATGEQLGKIRELLIKMGERQIDAPDATAPQAKVRFVPLSSDPESAIDSIREVWPRLRGNELKLLIPEQAQPKLPRALRVPRDKQPEPDTDPETSSRPADLDQQPALKDVGVAPNTTRQQAKGSSTGIALCRLSLPAGRGGPVFECSLSSGGLFNVPDNKEHAAGEPNALPVDSAAKPADPTDTKAQVPALDAQGMPDNSSESKPAPSGPPVYIVPGPNGVTIMSEDAEALSQLERLLAIFARPQPRGGRRFAVHILQSANAPRVADTLTRLYRNIPSYGRGRTGPVAFVGDERLNALVIFANRADQREIDELVDILDSDQLPDQFASNKPVVIPIANVKASVVEMQLRNLYKTQLTAGGGRPPLDIPSGVDAEVAAMIQQMNAIRQGPLMTIESDDETNSIMVVAPTPLLQEVQDFIKTIDAAAAENPRRGIRILPLREISGEEMDRTLNRILRQRGR